VYLNLLNDVQQLCSECLPDVCKDYSRGTESCEMNMTMVCSKSDLYEFGKWSYSLNVYALGCRLYTIE